MADPNIDLAPLVAHGSPDRPTGPYARFAPRELGGVPIAMPPGRRAAIGERMLSGATAEEREAAARALLPWPSATARLRVAEWGVWLNDKDGLKLARAVADEIPPFVHRAGNPISEMAGRIRPIMVVTKPVIHLTVDEAMPVDLSVAIRYGRPCFAYPKPDDFDVRVDRVSYRTGTPGGRPSFLAEFDPEPNFGSLADLGSGYPWLTPHHRMAGGYSTTLGSTNDITQLGVHWQSLIVTPSKSAWTIEPPVPADPKFAWWRRLRDVDCSWVSSRGEGERFLYYDGPTKSKAPYDVRLAGGVLGVTRVGWSVAGHGVDLTAAEPKDAAARRALFVRVPAGGGEVSGAAVQVTQELNATVVAGATADTIRGDRVEAALASILAARGLTASEAGGFLDCWRDAFFKKPGARLLMVMSPGDYDALCPMDVRPAPAERVRVGVIVTELTDERGVGE